MMRSPQTITSPWLPAVLVRLAHSSQLMISWEAPSSEMSIRRKPAYVPWTATSPQKARSELKLPEPGTVLSVSTALQARIPAA